METKSSTERKRSEMDQEGLNEWKARVNQGESSGERKADSLTNHKTESQAYEDFKLI